MALRLHRSAELGRFLPAQRMMQLGEEGRDGRAQKILIARTKQVDSRPVCQFNEAALIHRNDRRRTGFDQSFEPRLPFHSQPPVADQLTHEQA